MKLLCYDLKLTYIPGKQNVVPDVLSHSPLPVSQLQELECRDIQVCAIQATPRFMDKVQEATRNDACFQSVIKMTQEGWDTAALPECTPYAAVKDDLSIEKVMLFKGPRLVIPQTMKKEMLSRLHESHMGVVKSKNLNVKPHVLARHEP